MVGGSLYKSRYFTCGRLLCDTYLSARELIKENDFSLNYLAKQYLKKDQTEFNVENTIQSFESSTILSE
jgi:DNA polymerase alpha subunit A